MCVCVVRDASNKRLERKEGRERSRRKARAREREGRERNGGNMHGIANVTTKGVSSHAVCFEHVVCVYHVPNKKGGKKWREIFFVIT